MALIHVKTLQDLQFHVILEAVASHCITDMGREQVLLLVPFKTNDLLMENLELSKEYLSSFDNNNPLPNHGFETIDREIKMLRIANSTLEVLSFRKIKDVVSSSMAIVDFLKKNQEFYPSLLEYSDCVYHSKEIVLLVDRIIDKYGEVKNDASQRLSEIRHRLQGISGKINQSFARALSHYSSLGYLDDIRESVIDDRRVLAVLAMHRKKIKGQYLGSSKTGSILFIEPEQTLNYSRELSNLKFEEKEEIEKILKELTELIRPYTEQLVDYQKYLTAIDVLYAKSKYAKQINGVCPTFVEERKLYFKEALHPILWLSNQAKKEKTFAQTIELGNENRIIAISGPNAGGKSITLKTVGLLQLMIQSGIFIPVHSASETCWFDRILTDIGDNQSIENHLSTYSYRLKNMNYFLKKCNRNTLFLIDEFGTGSDPELGGALAEIFLEEFYQKEAFGIITTHYANLKLLVDELEYATNANMMFDSQSLEPTFQLQLGQAGSSFTFEVAQKNGIPFSLINRAKKKVEGGKVRFDKTIASMQKERHKLDKVSKELKKEEEKARVEGVRLEEINNKVQHKLERYQELFDANQKVLYLGQKLDDLAKRYFDSKNKKEFIAATLKLVEIENAKRKHVTKKERIKEEKQKEEVVKEVMAKVEEIRIEKKKKKEVEVKEEKPKLKPKLGDRVRMVNGKATGEIELIEKEIATVNYGLFISKVNIDELELVQAKKKK
ncbi:MAG: DNA mismatch repair protein MutS [Flavobacteriales bacterium]|nr:DNA mismatch repair protein MutS [Flavobacteriales bacterium]